MSYVTLVQVVTDLLTDALGAAVVINAGGVEVGEIAVAVTTVVEGGAHLEVVRLPEADVVGLKRRGGACGKKA